VVTVKRQPQRFEAIDLCRLEVLDQLGVACSTSSDHLLSGAMIE
jgi:hypothetical protein